MRRHQILGDDLYFCVDDEQTKKFVWKFGKIRKNHFHLNLFVGVLWKTLTGRKVFFLSINDPRLYPYFNVLVSWIEHVNVHVVRPATIAAFLIDSNEFLKNVTSKRSIIIGVENSMLVHNILADFSEGVPLILERMLSIFEILLKPWPCHFRIPLESGLKIRNLLERDILFLKIVKNITMMLSVEAKEHLWIVKITRVFYRFAHTVKYILIELNFIDFQLHMY